MKMCPKHGPLSHHCHHHSSSSGGGSSSSGGGSSGGGDGSSGWNADGWTDGDNDNGNGNGSGDESAYYSNNNGGGDNANYAYDDNQNIEYSQSNLDNGGTSNGADSFGKTSAAHIWPLIAGALVAGMVGAAFVISRVSSYILCFDTESNILFSHHALLFISSEETPRARRPPPKWISEETNEALHGRDVWKEGHPQRRSCSR